MIFLDTLMSWLQREMTFVWVAVQKEEILPGAPVVTPAVFRLIQNFKKELPLSFLCPGFVLDSNLKGEDPAPSPVCESSGFALIV